MDSSALTRTAGDLERNLLQKVKFYLRVGWTKGDSEDVLIVYYDRRESLPKNLVPTSWLGLSVQVQGTLPPGVQPPPPTPFQWAF